MENIDTPYLKMPKDVALMMASMLSLGEPRKPVISFAYTGSDVEYIEPVLNLRWSLSGEWKILDFKKMFNDDNVAFKKFLDLLRTEKDHFIRNQKLSHLCGPGFNTERLEVSGRSFDEGIRNLFIKITEKVKIQNGDTEMYLPVVLVKVEKNTNHNFYSAYMYVEEEKSFVNIWWPNEAPNYVKKFLEFEKNMLGEVAG